MQGCGARYIKTLTLQIGSRVPKPGTDLAKSKRPKSQHSINTGIRFSEAFSPFVEFDFLILNVMPSPYFVPVVEQRLVLLSTCLEQLTLSLSHCISCSTSV